MCACVFEMYVLCVHFYCLLLGVCGGGGGMTVSMSGSVRACVIICYIGIGRVQVEVKCIDESWKHSYSVYINITVLTLNCKLVKFLQCRPA